MIDILIYLLYLVAGVYICFKFTHEVHRPRWVRAMHIPHNLMYFVVRLFGFLLAAWGLIHLLDMFFFFLDPARWIL